MARLFDKFIGIMGFGDDEEEDFVQAGYDEEYGSRGEKPFRSTSGSGLDSAAREPVSQTGITGRENTTKRKSAPVVSIHTQKQVRVIVIEPVSFEEAQGIAEHLKTRKSVILNLENTDPALSQRIVDFISGTTYALGGNMQKVGNGIFLFVPNNVDISGEMSFRTNERDILWPRINN